jgi:hypothetical protein
LDLREDSGWVTQQEERRTPYSEIMKAIPQADGDLARGVALVQLEVDIDRDLLQQKQDTG